MRFKSLIRSIIIFIPIYSFLSILLLSLEVFLPLPSFIFSILLTYISYQLNPNFWTELIDFDKSLIIPLVGILLLALLFRFPPYKMIHGGQDQGVYVNMSAHFQRGEEACFNDKTRLSLNNQKLIDIYDSNRLNDINARDKSFNPGIYDSDCGSDYVFQFYHLFPLWMSLSGALLGDEGRFFVLIFFSLLSIIGLILLLFELTNRKNLSLLFGVFLALNPLHAFFSKWPVTEVPALAMSAIGLWLFYRVWKRQTLMKSLASGFGVFFAGAIFSLYFFTRISGFIYIPFVSFLLLLAIWKKINKEQIAGRNLLIFGFTLLGYYVISIFYGLEFSPIYSSRIYTITFGAFESLILPISISISVLLVFLVVMYKMKSRINTQRFETQVSNFINIGLPVLFIGFIVLGGINLFYNESLCEDEGWRCLLNHWTFWNWVIYSGVIMFPIGVYLFTKNIKYSFNSIFLVFLLAPIIYKFYLSPVIQYQLYYTRYLVSELLPYSLLYIFYLFQFIKIKYATIFTGIALIVPAYLSIMQFGVKEGEKGYEIINDIKNEINDDDILLIESDSLKIDGLWKISPLTFYTPLYVYHNQNVFPVQFEQLNQVTEMLLEEKFQGLFLLSPQKKQFDNYLLIDNYHHVLRSMEIGNFIPRKINPNYWDQKLYLYRYDGSIMGSQQINFIDDTWTSTNSTILYAPSRSHSGTLKLKTFGYNPLVLDQDALGLEIYLNELKAYFVSFDELDYEYIFEIPTSIEKIESLQIICNPFIPKELGIGNDIRELGIDIKEINF